jgi:ADP-heptose:LPS heptosyltransferase
LRSDFLRLRFNLSHIRVEHINKHRKGKRRLTAKNNKELVRQPTAIENYCEVFERLGYPVKMEPRECDGATVRRCEGNLSPQSPNIGIAPFAAHRGKIYPTEQMEQVVSQLCELHPDCRILLFGGGDKELEVFSRWCQRYPQCSNASQQAGNLREELQLMRQLDVMVSMDSANMHFASAVGVPVVSIWGATHPDFGFYGFGQDRANALCADLPCQPCSAYGSKPCRYGDRRCMAAITPEMVLGKIEAILKNNIVNTQ